MAASHVLDERVTADHDRRGPIRSQTAHRPKPRLESPASKPSTNSTNTTATSPENSSKPSPSEQPPTAGNNPPNQSRSARNFGFGTKSPLITPSAPTGRRLGLLQAAPAHSPRTRRRSHRPNRSETVSLRQSTTATDGDYPGSRRALTEANCSSTPTTQSQHVGSKTSTRSSGTDRRPRTIR